MAVSPQYLKPNLIDSIRAYLTPDVMSGASSIIHEPESATRLAMSAAVPTLLGGLVRLATSSDGVGKLTNLVGDGAFSPVADNAAALFGGGTPTTNMMSTGQQLLGNIFGDKSLSVSDAIAQTSGIRSGSATSLLGMLAPLALGVISKQASAQGLNGSSVANLLLSQKESILGGLPSGIAQLLGLTGPRVVPPAVDSIREVPRAVIPAAARAETNFTRWLWIGAIALAVLLLWLFARSRGPSEALARVTLPNGTSLSVPEGSLNYNLASYMASNSQSVPRTFTFDHLNFQTASTDITPDSAESVSDLALILKAYPNAQVQLAGHTDNTGGPDANQKLSVDRANAVKAMLVSSGVAPDRISTTGFGQTRPVAPNDTDEGRARNRRLELIVTSK